MATITYEQSGKAGSCMFCPHERMFVNVLMSESIIVRICDSCLDELRLTKFAPDGGKSTARKVVSNRKAVPSLKAGSRRRR
jgi:hypothetical protein